MTERTYPVARPDSGSDKRFTMGLVMDVMDVLTEHGYPEASMSGLDHVAMQQALFRFIYGPAAGITADPVGEVC